MGKVTITINQVVQKPFHIKKGYKKLCKIYFETCRIILNPAQVY